MAQGRCSRRVNKGSQSDAHSNMDGITGTSPGIRGHLHRIRCTPEPWCAFDETAGSKGPVGPRQGPRQGLRLHYAPRGWDWQGQRGETRLEPSGALSLCPADERHRMPLYSKRWRHPGMCGRERRQVDRAGGDRYASLQARRDEMGGR